MGLFPRYRVVRPAVAVAVMAVGVLADPESAFSAGGRGRRHAAVPGALGRRDQLTGSRVRAQGQNRSAAPIAGMLGRWRRGCSATLRAHGADPSAVNTAGQSPVGLARAIANYPVAQFFADFD